MAGKFTVARVFAGGSVRIRRAGCFESPLKTSLIKLIDCATETFYQPKRDFEFLGHSTSWKPSGKQQLNFP